MRVSVKVWLGVGLCLLMLSLLDSATMHLSAQALVSTPGAPTAGPKKPHDETLPLGFAQKSFPNATKNIPFLSSVQAIGGSGIYALTLIGDLPPGMRYETGDATFEVVGIPTTTGDYPFVLSIEDSSGATHRGEFTLHVDPLLPGAIALNSPQVTDAETFNFSDVDNVFFPAVIAINENFLFLDVETELDSGIVTDNENFTFGDTEVITIVNSSTITWAPIPVVIPYNTGLVAGQLNATAFNVGGTNISADGTFAYFVGPVANNVSATVGTILPAGTDQLCVVWTPKTSPINYSLLYGSATSCTNITVTAAPAPVVTAISYTISYGSPDPSISPAVLGTNYTLTGLLGSDTCSGAPTLTYTPATPVNVGSYPITVTTGTLDCGSNYAAPIFSNGTLTITKTTATLVLTSSNGTSTYGTAPNVAADYTLTGFINGDSQALACTGAPTVTTTATAVSPVSPPTYAITAAHGALTCTNSATTTYSIVIGSNSGLLTINKANLSLSATHLASVVYGQAIPSSFAYTLTGFAGPDTQASACSGVPVLATSAVLGSPVGGYTINVYPNPSENWGNPIPANVGNLVCPNYFLVLNSGVLHITPATLTVTPNNSSIPYGGNLPVFTYGITGYVNGDPTSVVTGTPTLYTTAATKATSTPGVIQVISHVGTYAIKSSWGSLKAANYTFQFSQGTLTVTPATTDVTVTALNAGKGYGASLPTLNYSVTGLIGTDTVASATSGTPSITTTAQSVSAVGSYPITAAAGTFVASSDYAGVHYVNGTFKITPATLTVTAQNKTVAYGSQLTPYNYTMTGFVNGDTQATAITGVPTINATATSHVIPSGVSVYISPVGTYSIQPTWGSLKSLNYAFNFVPGSLTLTKAANITVTARNVIVTKAANVPSTYSYTVGGLSYYDTIANATTGTPSITSTATTSSLPGSYPITAAAGSFAASSNYAGVNYVNGTLTIQ